METKFYLGFLPQLYVIFIPLMSPRRKEQESFCVEVFSQGMKEHQTEKYPRQVKTISLGMPQHPCTPSMKHSRMANTISLGMPPHPPIPTTPRFANLLPLFFEQHRNLQKLGASISISYVSFVFHSCFQDIINKVSVGVKFKFALHKRNKRMNSYTKEVMAITILCVMFNY